MKVHTFFIALTVFLMGVLCLTSANELIETPLGKRISLGLGFSGLSGFLYSFSGTLQNLAGKGKAFETTMHVVFSLLWVYLSGIFLSNGFN